MFLLEVFASFQLERETSGHVVDAPFNEEGHEQQSMFEDDQEGHLVEHNLPVAPVQIGATISAEYVCVHVVLVVTRLRLVSKTQHKFNQLHNQLLGQATRLSAAKYTTKLDTI